MVEQNRSGTNKFTISSCFPIKLSVKHLGRRWGVRRKPLSHTSALRIRRNFRLWTLDGAPTEPPFCAQIFEVEKSWGKIHQFLRKMAPDAV